MRTAAMIYSMRTSLRWLRQLAGSIDHELALVCMRHWQQARAPAGPGAVHKLEAVSPAATRADLRR